mmetsp:Transcript_47452/g.82874  ORF Transcript_47452/g.82874 Transcript_47452/m.82874 type:complete len:207 (-) Transcript_47452:19-639(-)
MHAVDTAARTTAPQATQKATFGLVLYLMWLGFVVGGGRVGQRVLRRVCWVRSFGQLNRQQRVDMSKAVGGQRGEFFVTLGQSLQDGACGMHGRAAPSLDVRTRGSGGSCSSRGGRSSSRRNVTRRTRRSSRRYPTRHCRNVCVVGFVLGGGITVGADQRSVVFARKRQTGLRVGPHFVPRHCQAVVQNRRASARWSIACRNNGCLR